MGHCSYRVNHAECAGQVQGLLYFPENDGRSRKAETGGKVEWQNLISK